MLFHQEKSIINEITHNFIYNPFFKFFVTDKKDLYIIIGGLESLCKNLTQLSQNLIYEVDNIKSLINSSESNNSGKRISKIELPNYALTFYENYLVKILNNHNELKKREIKIECERKGKKLAPTTITKYLAILVKNTYIISRRNPKKKSERLYTLH